MKISQKVKKKYSNFWGKTSKHLLKKKRRFYPAIEVQTSLLFIVLTSAVCLSQRVTFCIVAFSLDSEIKRLFSFGKRIRNSYQHMLL